PICDRTDPPTLRCYGCRTRIDTPYREVISAISGYRPYLSRFSIERGRPELTKVVRYSMRPPWQRVAWIVREWLRRRKTQPGSLGIHVVAVEGPHSRAGRAVAAIGIL